MTGLKGLPAALLAATFVVSTAISGGSAAGMGFSFGGDDSVGITFGNGDDDSMHSDDHGDFGHFSIDVGGDTHIGDDATPSGKMTQAEEDMKKLQNLRGLHDMRLRRPPGQDKAIGDFLVSLGIDRPTVIKGREECLKAVRLAYELEEDKLHLKFIKDSGHANSSNPLYQPLVDKVRAEEKELVNKTDDCTAFYKR